MIRILFIFLLLLPIGLGVASTTLKAQDRLNISAGIGFPDLLNVGLRIPIKQNQIGFNIGALKIGIDNFYTYSLNTYWHFAGKSQYSTRRPWYWKNGVSVFNHTGPQRRKNYTYFNSRIGIEGYLSEKLGFQFEMGAGRLLRYREEGSFSSFLDLTLPDLVPGIAFSFFYRI